MWEINIINCSLQYSNVLTLLIPTENYLLPPQFAKCVLKDRNKEWECWVAWLWHFNILWATARRSWFIETTFPHIWKSNILYIQGISALVMGRNIWGWWGNKTNKKILNLTHCSDVEAPERAECERNKRACGLGMILDLGMIEQN